MEVVVAKIQAVLRRSYAFVSEKALCCVGNVTLDLTEAVLHYKEKELKLSGNEFGILKILMKNPKRPVSREELMRSLWESGHFIDDNTLTVNVTRLRKKLELRREKGLAIRSGRSRLDEKGYGCPDIVSDGDALVLSL